MRDNGSTWPEIRAAWETLTGEKTGSSTLPNRYVRLKSNFTVVQEEDLPRLLEAKRSVEEAFEKGKWGMVAEAVEKMGGEKYRVSGNYMMGEGGFYFFHSAPASCPFLVPFEEMWEV